MEDDDDWAWLSDEIANREAERELYEIEVAARRVRMQEREATRALQDACEHVGITYFRFRQDNGIDQIRAVCDDCGHPAPLGKLSISRAEAKELRLVIDTLPLRYSRWGRSNKPCEVCGNPDAENHHWAPRHIFGIEADIWPMSWLCRSCHTAWHRLVTPTMHQRKAS